MFKEGDTEHYVEVEILYDSVREMREAFTVHLKPDENMVAETKVKIQVKLAYNLTVKCVTTWLSITLEGSSNLLSVNIAIIALAFQSTDEQSHNLYRGDQQHGGCHLPLGAQSGFSVALR